MQIKMTQEEASEMMKSAFPTLPGFSVESINWEKYSTDVTISLKKIEPEFAEVPLIAPTPGESP